MKEIAPSILAADFWKLGEEVKLMEAAGAKILHIDIMDGQFVPNISMGPFVVETINRRSDLVLDVHLMINRPSSYLEDFVKAGADYLTIHYEACPHLHREIQKIKALGAKVGVAINPHTPIGVLTNIIKELDLVLIMSVNPGFGGQKFIYETLNKVRALRKILIEKKLENQVKIEVDGGVYLGNVKEVASAGVDIMVAGSAIYSAEDPKKVFGLMVDLLN